MKKTLSKLSKELRLPEEVIIKAYKAYWMFIKEKIKSLPLKEDIDEETFNAYKVNFNIPNLGKLACTYNRYVGMKKRKEIKDKIKKEKNAEYKED